MIHATEAGNIFPFVLRLAAVIVKLRPFHRRYRLLASVFVLGATMSASAQPTTEFATGAPTDPSSEWTLSAGGRLYDSWWLALGKEPPKSTNPAYPDAGKATGANTWRCKECHGWDYRGREGDYSTGSHYSGIAGIRNAQGKPPSSIEKILRDKNHPYTPDMLSDVDIKRLAEFVSKGQHDTRRAIKGKPGKSTGSVARGKAVFQTTCAACHGFDGKLLNWGNEKTPEYIGTAANEFPEEFLHKTRNSHPGAAMINLRAFPLQDSIDVFAYAQTLPQK